MSGKENMKSIIYISKRCPYCRKLLLLLQNKPELKGSIQIVSIDDEPFPKMVKSVPTMISNGEIWTADELFAALEGRPDKKQMATQQQPRQQPQQQQSYQEHIQHQQQQMQPGNSQQGTPPSSESDEMLDGYFGGSDLAGGSLGYASIDDIPTNIETSYFATLDGNDNVNMVDVQNDGYVQKGKKSQQFDNDYERMMAERGEIGQGQMRVGGGL